MIQSLISVILYTIIMYSQQIQTQNIFPENIFMCDPSLLYLHSLKIQYQNQILWELISNITTVPFSSQPNDSKAESTHKDNLIEKTQTDKTVEEEQLNNDSEYLIDAPKRYKNDTKNISKNFGKAIITFVQKNPKIISQFLEKENISYSTYIFQLKKRKRDLNTIANLRELWCEDSFEYAKVTRMISLHYLKKASLKYVFNSRIENYMGHIKYRNRLIQVLKKPQQFTCMKTF